MSGARAAIYHFTDESSIRPVIYEKEIKRIKAFAMDMGYSDVDVYMDKSLKLKEQLQLQNLMQNVSDYEALVMKDFYHLRKNTGTFMSDLIALSNKNVSVYTIEDGSFSLKDAPFEQPLRVAIYYCGLEIIGRSIDLQLDIMKYFIQTCTNWQVVDKYADASGNKVDGNQKQVQCLIKNRDKYDIVLVQSFNDVHWRTAKFCKVRHQLQKDIYSMHENMYLQYGKGEAYEV